MVPLGGAQRRAGLGLDGDHRAGRRPVVRGRPAARHQPERSADGLGGATTSRSSARRSAIVLTRTVQVTPGKVTPIKIDFPKGTIALNAAPWAEVWVDGEKLGDTPIGNLSLTLGAHDIVFRHPESRRAASHRNGHAQDAGAPQRRLEEEMKLAILVAALGRGAPS